MNNAIRIDLIYQKMEGKTMDNQVLLDVREVAEKIFLGKKTVQAIQRAVRQRQLPFVKIGNRVFFLESELRTWLRDQMTASITPASPTPDDKPGTGTIRRL